METVFPDGYAGIRQSSLVLKGSPITGENPQPFFRRPDLSLAGKDFPKDKYRNFGNETGFRVLPYTMQDRYDRRLTDVEFDTVVLENEFLRAEFIPALGGRLWSLFDKKRNRDILYRNPVFRPANLAIREAWFSGGIEWNIGRLGHTVHTCSPVFAGTLDPGVLRLWEFERQTRLFWRIECTLPPGSPSLFIYTRIENPDNRDKPLYWWANAAIPQTPGVRVFSSSHEVIFVSAAPGKGTPKALVYGSLPDLPVLPGKDASYPAQSYYANEYFFQNDCSCGKNGEKATPWESAVYEDGYAYGEVSTAPLIYRKMWCWGNGRGGRRWQDFLSLPGEEYVEVQAGLAPTQLHTADIAAGGVTDWVQAFTAFEADPETAHQKNYTAAAVYVGELLAGQIGKSALENALEAARNRSAAHAAVLFSGSGWGALEKREGHRERPTGAYNTARLSGLSFPDESIGKAETPWAELLRTGELPLRSPEAGPGSFAVDENWEALLEKSREREGDWLTPYHLGVIAFEKGDAEKAVRCWEKSLDQKENAWALRNLALAAIKKDTEKGIAQALDYYKRALTLSPSASLPDQSFLEEYIPLLLKAGREEEAAAELARAGSVETLAVPLLETTAELALRRGDDDLLDRIFSIEPAHIREGNTALTDIWTEREIRRLCRAGKNRREAEEQIRQSMAEEKLTPPWEIDFRMY